MNKSPLFDTLLGNSEVLIALDGTPLYFTRIGIHYASLWSIRELANILAAKIETMEELIAHMVSIPTGVDVAGNLDEYAAYCYPTVRFKFLFSEGKWLLKVDNHPPIPV